MLLCCKWGEFAHNVKLVREPKEVSIPVQRLAKDKNNRCDYVLFERNTEYLLNP